jgi:hypothetical protein
MRHAFFSLFFCIPSHISSTRYGFVIEDNFISDIKNLSPPPFDRCTDYHELDDEENGNQTQAQNIRGIHVSGFQ